MAASSASSAAWFLDVSVKMARITGLNNYLYQLTNKSLPEAMDVATFYSQNKRYKLPE